MNVHVSFKAGKTPDIAREIQTHIQKLQRRLRVFKPDMVHFHALIDQESGQRYSVSLNLRLPTGQVAAQQSGANLLTIIKSAFADLLSQISKHKELLRRRWRHKRVQGVLEVEPPEMPAVSATSHEAQGDQAPQNGELEKWLSTNLTALKSFIEHELQYRISAGELRRDQITPEEVMDEAVLSALSHENGRAALLPSDRWFQRLALQAVRRLVRASSDIGNLSLDDPAGTENVVGDVDNVLRHLPPDEAPPEEILIGNLGEPSPEQLVATEEMVGQLDAVLREVSSLDREAFVLYALEGFTVDEISRLVGRPPEQVRQAIRKARQQVERKLPPQNDLKRSLLGRSRVA
jgi:RNA polymerase sigma factor (sigma-70 family)